MRFRDFHPNIQIRVLVNFLNTVASTMVVPLMSIYYAERLGTGITGVLLAVNVLAGLFSGFFGGYISDRYGRKRLMVASESVMVLCFLISACANSAWLESAWLTFAMTLAISVCWGFFGPSSDAMLLDVSTSEQRKYIYGIQYWINNLGTAIGGLVGAFLFRDYLFELLLAMAATGLFSVIVTLLFIKETYQGREAAMAATGMEIAAAEEPRKGVWDLLANYRSVMRDRVFLLFVAAGLLSVSVEFHLGSYFSVRLAEEMPEQRLFGWFGRELSFDGVEAIGLLRTENTVLVVLLAAFSARIFSRFRDSRVLLVGFFLYIIGYSVLGYSNMLTVLLVSMFLATLGEVMCFPIQQAYLGNIAPPHARSSYMAVYGLTYRGALLLSSFAVVLGGIFPSWAMAVGIGFTGFAGVALLFAIMPDLEKRKETAR